MDSLVAVALIVAASTIVQLVVSDFLARRVRREEHARQDKVAGLVAVVATNVEAATTTMNQKLDVIHTLVNSDMTKALRGQLVALEAHRVMLLDLPQTDTRVELQEALAVQISELRVVLSDRDRQAGIAAQIVAEP